MKTFFLTMTILAFIMQCSAQSLSDYEYILSKFMYYHNNGLGDSIAVMDGSYADWQALNWEFKTSQGIAKLNKDHFKYSWMMQYYGEMKAFKFMAIEPEDSVRLYKVWFAKSIHCLGFTLVDKNNSGNFLIGTFRPETSSPFIDSLMKIY